LIFVNDDSEDWTDTRAFLARRIDGIMRFEKAKAKWTGGGANRHFSMARFLGRLRYPAI
jgi:ubiquinone biosynthesis protein COQ9